MTNNRMLRLITFTVILFCFITMFLTATFSVPADLDTEISANAPVMVSAVAGKAEAQPTAISAAAEPAEGEMPSI